MARHPKIARVTKGKQIPSKIYVGRTKGKSDFTACVRVGGRVSTMQKSALECAHGSNPREAVAAALRKSAAKIEGRRGTYRGRR